MRPRQLRGEKIRLDGVEGLPANLELPASIVRAHSDYWRALVLNLSILLSLTEDETKYQILALGFAVTVYLHT